jgi:hypothetical protein
MAVAVNIGGILVDVDELDQRRHQIDDLVRVERGGVGPATRSGGLPSRGGLEFSSGSVALEALLDEMRTDQATTVAGTIPHGPPVELGRPLHIEVITAYSGHVGRRRETDLLVASAVKNTASHDAMPKAVNQVFRGVSDGRTLRPGAFNQGSPTVYYSPALDEATLLFGVDMVLDSFNDSLFRTLSGLLGFAAGIPIFAPAGAFLLAGSQMVRMAGNLGRALFETGPILRSRYEIRFNEVWFQLPSAGLMVLWPDRLSDVELRGLNARYGIKVDDGGRQVYLAEKDAGQAPYQGEAPYMIVNLNTTDRPELRGFRPQHASAALLEQFYGSEAPGQAAVHFLKEALSLYNDFDYQKRALVALEQIERLRSDPAGNAESIAEQERLYARYLKNVVNDEMRKLVEARAESSS